MTAVAENEVATRPRDFLNKSQREALAAIGFYRNQYDAGSYLQVGNKRFAKQTVVSLLRFELLRKSGRGYAPTMAGVLAIERLKGGGK